MNDFNMIGDLLARIDTFLNGAYAQLNAPIMYTAAALATISIVLMGMLIAAGGTDDIWGMIIRKTLLFGFAVLLIDHWQTIVGQVYDSGIWLGLRASGNQLSVADFVDVSGIARTGVRLAVCEFQWADQLSGFDIVWNIPKILFLYVAAVFIVAGFGAMALAVFLTIVGMKLMAVVAYCLLPFIVFERTAWLTEHAFRYVAGAAVKVLTMAVVVSFAIGFITQARAINECSDTLPNLDQVMATWFGTYVLMFLIWKIPSMASSVIMSGSGGAGLHSLLSMGRGFGSAGGSSSASIRNAAVIQQATREAAAEGAAMRAAAAPPPPLPPTLLPRP